MEKEPVKPVRLSGVDVCFPHDPYGVQKVFMAQVVRAIDHNENALLEAPTGCGKTLSLLCGALAWQTSAKEKKAAADKAAVEKAEAAKAAAAKVAADPIEDTQDDSEAGAVTSPSEKAAQAAAEEPPEEPIIVPKIYYATRTHSQIAQVVRELKRTIYKPKMAVLGARPHYCINQSVIRKGNIDAECEELLKDGMGCKYKKNANSIGHGLVRVHDIEDLAKIGKRHTACPYFVARHLADSAELIFCPYSYLLDPNIRRSTRINASDAILIFDEAHNIEDQAREAGTMELELEQLKGSVMALIMAANTSAEAEPYRELSDAIVKLINWMLAQADGNSGGAPGQGFKSVGFESFERIWDGGQLLSALSEAGLGAQEVEHLWACYEKAKAAEEKAGFATEGEAALEPVPAEVKTPRAGGNALGCVASLLSVLRLMYGTYTEAPSAPSAGAAGAPGSSGGAAAAAAGSSALEGPVGVGKVVQSAPGMDHVADYRLAVQMWLPRETNHNNRGRRDRRRPDPSSDGFAETTGCAAATTQWAFRFCLWCLNPAVVFRSLSQVARSVLLTSGTLSPLDSFSGELGLDFHVRLEAPHVVDVNRQVFSRVVSHGLDGRKLRATYKEADQLDYQDSLGQLLLATASTVPDGLLLFLPSYAVMEKLSKRWQDTGLMAQLQRVKAVFSEPRQAGDAFDTAIRRYYEAVDEGQGGLFMAVCRGKVSEGIDFADARARCVMVVGIPYPHAKDSKVALKKEYNNFTAAASARAVAAVRHGPYGSSSAGRGPPRLLTGDAWYSQQAFRALNQAIGRCIRHRLDYGAILLVDERFKEPRNQTSLSKWVRGTIRPAANTQTLLTDMAGFFHGLAACPPGSAAAAALPMHLNPQQQQQQQQMAKPGYEQQPGQLVKPGFESAPGMASGAGSCKPGFEAMPGMAGCSGMGPDQGCCGGGPGQGGLPGPSSSWGQGGKPGYEAQAGAGMGLGAPGGDARSKWQQPQLLPGGKQTWQQQKPPPPPQQQQQQQKPKGEQPQQQQGTRRMSGPMDAYLVKAAAKQQQQQQQTGVPVKQEQGQLGPDFSHPQQQQHQQQHQQLAPQGFQQQQHSQQAPQGFQQQQQQRSRGQPVSCLNALQGMPLPSPPPPTAQQQHWQQQQQQQQGLGPQQQQQQQQPLKPLDCNVPSTPAGGGIKTMQQNMPGSASKQFTPYSGSKQQVPAAGTVVAGTPQPAGQAATTAGVTPQQQQQQQQAGLAAGSSKAFKTAAQHTDMPGPSGANHLPAPGAQDAGSPGGTIMPPPPAAAAAVAEGSSDPDLQRDMSSLGLNMQLVQQWVAGDVDSMVRCLQQQQQAAGAASGMQLQELACFGIMASFDKALEVCQQQQQQRQQAQQPGSNATSVCNLAQFWQQWHSYIPTGLLVAAAAAGQAPPEAAVAQADRRQWQGPWLQVMRQQELRHTLMTMVQVYDHVLEQQQQQQQPAWAGGVQEGPGQAGNCGYAPQQQQQQQQWNRQQQQQQQPHQQGWAPPRRPDMPAPPSRPPQRQLPASLQQQQHGHAQRPGNIPSSTTAVGQAYSNAGPYPNSEGVMRFSGVHSTGANTVAATAAHARPGAGTGAVAAGCPAQGQQQPLPKVQLPKLQLSQSAKQPKRAAVLSAKAQLAMQKRSKGAAGQAVAKPPPLPTAAEGSDEDDDFI